jgi:hypothetical protein
LWRHLILLVRHLRDLWWPFMRHAPAYKQTTTEALGSGDTQIGTASGAITMGWGCSACGVLRRCWLRSGLWLILWWGGVRSRLARRHLWLLNCCVLLSCPGPGITAAEGTTSGTKPGFVGQNSVTTSTPPGAASTANSLPRGVLCLAPGT